MRLLLPNPILKRLERELRHAGRKETGGLLMGEHLHDEVFRVVDMTVQHSPGSEVCFVRDPGDHRLQLQEFFARTSENYSRFNYLGEWHSHPNFETRPSSTDIATMRSLVEDSAVAVNFLILLIVRLSRRGSIEMSSVAFVPGSDPVATEISLEDDHVRQSQGRARQWLRRIFRF